MIFNFGSINIDHVYSVPHLPAPGETLAAHGYKQFLGGKGINQSIAAYRADARIMHVGAVGADGDWALERITQTGVSTEAIRRIDQPTGHAIINVDEVGENAIVLLPGANVGLTQEQIDLALQSAKSGDWVLLQNETNMAVEIVNSARAVGCKVAYSAAPFVAETVIDLLPKTDLLFVNEGEANNLAKALGCAVMDIPVPELLVTLGSKGAWLKTGNDVIEQSAFPVEAVDTTGAGDTFTGAFLGRLEKGLSKAQALEYAAAASALQVTSHGASDAIPNHDEVTKFLNKQKGA